MNLDKQTLKWELLVANITLSGSLCYGTNA